MNKPKKIQPKADIVESLINLREELMERTDTTSREMVFKINSCLFSKYPHY